MKELKNFITPMVFIFSSFAIGFVAGIKSQKTLTTECKPDTVEVLIQPAPDTIHIERATTYQPTAAQCDSDPLTTADGSRINPDSLQRWVALSRDLLKRWGGEFSFGDTITIYSKTKPQVCGEWVVHDCMNARYQMSIDFLMSPEDNYPKLGVGTDVKIIVCSEN